MAVLVLTLNLKWNGLNFLGCHIFNIVRICLVIQIFFKKDFIYLFMRDTPREEQRLRQREKQAPCREPDVGLNPRSPGSCPGLKAAVNAEPPDIPLLNLKELFP